MHSKDIKYFDALVKFQNYTRVAEEFSVTQPTITQAVKRLEKEFGSQLVVQDWSHQKTVITRAGLLLSKNGAMIEHYLSLAHHEIDNTKKSQIRLGLPPIIGTYYFPQVAGQLLSTGLLKQTNIVESGSDELLKKLKKSDIDIALLGSIRPLHLNDIDSVHLGSRPFVIIVSPENPLSNRDSVSFSELIAERFINLTDRYVHPIAFKAYCEYADIDPNVIYYSPDISWAKSLVKANIGIAFIEKDVINNSDGVKILEITDDLPVRFNISVATRKGYILNESEKHFMEIIEQMRVS